MLALQFLAIGGDALALYLCFVAIGVLPSPWTVLMGFVVAMSGAAVIGAPGGGGGFETIMSAFFATHGLRADQAIAAAVLYRLVAFWLPVAITPVVLFRLRRRRREIRAAKRSAA
jgi:glycosyltransferase 2 family protein